MASSTRIEGGCTRTGDASWSYTYTTTSGITTLLFTADVGVVPKIGDSINAGALVPLVGHLINEDHSRWIKLPDEEWPLGSNKK